MALDHSNDGSERHDSWFEVEALTRTTCGSPRSEYSVNHCLLGTPQYTVNIEHLQS